MNNRLFVEANLVQACNSIGTALGAATTYPTTLIDVGDVKSFAFLIHLGVVVSGLTWQVQQCKTNNNSDTSQKNVTGAVLVTVGTDDDKWLIVEVNTENLDSNNGFHFVGLLETGGTVGDFADIFFFGLTPGVQPPTQPTGFLASVAVAG